MRRVAEERREVPARKREQHVVNEGDRRGCAFDVEDNALHARRLRAEG
jgi:hypothetical protein